MNVLIVGLGYAGTRFYQAFSNINQDLTGQDSIRFAYVSRSPKRSDIPYFADVRTAIAEFDPQIVVVSVNDVTHMEILQQLEGFKGFVICEKPLVRTEDDLKLLESRLQGISGFCMDLVERYSDTTVYLKEYVQKQNLRLIRANFHWGKDRINDHRPTVGVNSEIIHPLDLVKWICAPEAELELKNVQGVRSDFSISGSEVLDSAAIIATLGEAAVTGYSSFVNIVRKREVDLTFASPENKLVFATMVFDTPVWDVDYLRIWERTASGEEVLMEMKTEIDSRKELETIRKLMRLVHDVTGYVANGKPPSQPFADLQTSLQLQRLLNQIEHEAKALGPVKYVLGSEREFFTEENNWERLG